MLARVISARHIRLMVLGLSVSTLSLHAQAVLGVGPDIVFNVQVSSTIDPINPVGRVTIGAGLPGGLPVNVKFQYTGVTPVNSLLPTPPNFVVVTPSTGLTASSIVSPAEVLIGLNQSVVQTMSPGDYSLSVNFSTLDQTPPSVAHVFATLRLSPPPPPTIAAVVNTATYQAAISPGTLVSIFGSNFGPSVMSTQYDDKGLYPTAISDRPDGVFGNTTVTFGGIAAPITYVNANQINAMVPYGLAGQKTAAVVVTCYHNSTVPLAVPIQDTSPGIFTATQNGTGQGAVLNAPAVAPNDRRLYTYNGPDHPAPKGSAIEMYATGVGGWSPAVPDGAVALTALNPMCSDSAFQECTKLAAKPLTLTIGGKPATILYAGTLRYEPWSLIQINAIVPQNADSGTQPVVLTIGPNDNAQQKITMVIQ